MQQIAVQLVDPEFVHHDVSAAVNSSLSINDRNDQVGVSNESEGFAEAKYAITKFATDIIAKLRMTMLSPTQVVFEENGTHPNMTLVRPSLENPSVPEVPSTRGQPQLKQACGSRECCKISLTFVCGACGFLVLVATVLWFLEPELLCGVNLPTVYPGCIAPDASVATLVSPECNTCASSVDYVCDEPHPGSSGECRRGTDSLDCLVQHSEVAALYAVQSESPDELPDSGLLTIVLELCFLFILVVIVMPLSLWKLERFPVAMDQVFEVVRSSTLAIVEAVSMMLLLTIFFLSFVFDVRFCRSSFVVAPVQFAVNFGTEHSFGNLSPTSSKLPREALQMRSDQQLEKFVLLVLFILRFIMCNLANSRWHHHAGSGCLRHGLTLVGAMFLSIWSLPLMISDLQHCRYPLAQTNSEGYCTIYGPALPSGGISAQQFLHDCDLQSRTGWNNSEISFRQLFLDAPNPDFEQPSVFSAMLDNSEINAAAPSTVLSFVKFLSYTFVNSRASAYSVEAYEAAQNAASASGNPSQTPPDPNETTPSMTCFANSGTVLEGLYEYIAECEGNDEMRESTLLVTVLTGLNGIEVLMLFKICADSLYEHKRSDELHLNAGASSSVFSFPTRLIVAIVVGWLLVIFFFASQIDMTATRITHAVQSFEATYEQVIPQLRGPSTIPYFGQILPPLASIEYQNNYFSISTSSPSGGQLPPLAYFPPYHDLDGDCPCSLVDNWYSFLTNGDDPLYELALEVLLNPVSDAPTCADGDPCLYKNSTFCCVGNELFCPDDEKFDAQAKRCFDAAHRFVRLFETPRCGALIKCSMEYLRRLYEPFPFSLRWGGIFSLCSAAISNFLFLRRFRTQGTRLRWLVDNYFDPVSGWPRNRGTIPLASDRELLGGTEMSDLLPYELTKLPSFVGLYVGNFVVVYLIYTVMFAFMLYILLSKALPSFGTTIAIFAAPIAFEILLRYALWTKTGIVGTQHGIKHPRLFATIDLVLSLTSAITGPIKTIGRIFGAQTCTFVNLFRVDRCLMADPSLVRLDIHHRATRALLTSLRIRYEFEAIQKMRANQSSRTTLTTTSTTTAAPQGHVGSGAE
eukprot:SAG31_NODE_1031_length_10234_cov_6.100049_9_plen_1085_part_00